MAGFNVIAAALSSVLDIELAETNGDEQKLIAHFKIGRESKPFGASCLDVRT